MTQAGLFDKRPPGATPPPALEPFVAYLRLYHRGPDRAVPSAVLAMRFSLPTGNNGRPGVPGSRDVTELVLTAQEAGFPITRNHDGFFWATDPAHFDFHRRDVVARLRKFTRHLQGIDHALSCLASDPEGER